jgi:hypothetical protein
LLKD